MQLILMKDLMWCQEKDYYDISISKVFVLRDKVICRDGKDEVARKLLSDLLPNGKSELKVDFPEDSSDASPSPTLYGLQLTHVENDNILKNLRDRFLDKVKISVVFGKEGDESYERSTGEMYIRSENYDCIGSIDLDLGEYPYHKFDQGYDDVPMTIMAEISLPDEDILASVPLVPLGKKVFQEMKFADVIIISKKGTKIDAHKCFLSAASPVLEAAFAHDGFEESKTGLLDMSDVSEKGVKALLRYLYYEDMAGPNEDLGIAYELLYASHKYNIPPLEACVKELLIEKRVKDFTLEWAFVIFGFVRNIEAAAELKSKTALILMKNACELDDLPQYKELLEENPQSANALRVEISKTAAEYEVQRKSNRKRKLSD